MFASAWIRKTWNHVTTAALARAAVFSPGGVALGGTYVQTYSTADRTIANPTATTVTDNGGGAAADGTIGAVTAPTALTDNGGGTGDGTVSTMPDIAITTGGGNTYTDAAVNTAVNGFALTVRNNMKEVTTTLVANRTAIIALTDAVKELSTAVNLLIADDLDNRKAVTALIDDLQASGIVA